MVETSINTLLSRIIVTIQHSEKGSLSFLIGESTSLKRVTDLLDKQLAEKGKLIYDISKPSQPLLSFLESTKGDFDTPVVYVLGFDEVDGQERVNFYKYLNFHRESLREIEVNYVFLMNRDHESEFLQFAPDLASIRSGVFYLPEQAKRLAFQNGLVRILDMLHKPVGAGFLISDNQAITCAHLILMAMGRDPDSQEMPKSEIAIDFPFLEPKGFASGVIKVWNRAADIAILDLRGDLPENRQPVELISETNLGGHNFRTFGFPIFADTGIWSNGEIVSVAGDKSLMQLSDQASSGFQLQAGFSGAPVWDDNLQGVVGIILRAERESSLRNLYGKNIEFVPVSKILEIYNPLTEVVSEQLVLIRERYFSHIKRVFNLLDFKGMPQLSNLPMKLSLEDVYVQLLARPELPKGETWERRLTGRSLESFPLTEEWKANAIKEIKEERESWEALTPVRIDEVLLRESRVVVLGDPGSGKSTMLRHLALRLIEEPNALIPIPISLSSYAGAFIKNELTLQEYLPAYYASADIAGLEILFTNALKDGRAIVMLDGLDEVLQDRASIVKEVEKFTNKMSLLGNHVIVTSRIAGYRVAPLSTSNWTTYILLELHSEEIESFVKKWYFAIEKNSFGDTAESLKSANKEATRLLDTIKQNPGVARLAPNPLLLTILVLVSRQWIDLPKSRVILYDRYLETLIESWNRARSLDQRTTSINLDYESNLDILSFLALRIHENSSGTGLATADEIETWLINYFRSKNKRLNQNQAKEKSVEFLHSVRLYSNLLVERGERLYGFVHLTFEEMLAAYGLFQMGQIELDTAIEYIRNRVADPAWREVILLFVGILGVLNRMPRSAGEVVRAIMDMNLEETNKGQNIILAGYCLADIGEKGVGANVADEVRKKLVEQHHDQSLQPHVQSEAGRVLGQTGWKPYDLGDWVMVHRGKFLYGTDNQVEIIKKNFGVGKYPVTNLQYMQFVEDGGYLNQSYWTAAGWKWLRENNVNHPLFWESSKWNNPLLPVVGVSWYEATAYCQWLSEKIARIIFLPSAKQWERAARGKEGMTYPWGNQFTLKAFNSIDFWQDMNEPLTTVVTQFPNGANVDGIYDLCGNVWEWTSEKSGKYYVVYGGSWAQQSEIVNGKLQFVFSPTTQSNQIGFRVFTE